MRKGGIARTDETRSLCINKIGFNKTKEKGIYSLKLHWIGDIDFRLARHVPIPQLEIGMARSHETRRILWSFSSYCRQLFLEHYPDTCETLANMAGPCSICPESWRCIPSSRFPGLIPQPIFVRVAPNVNHIDIPVTVLAQTHSRLITVSEHYPCHHQGCIRETR